MEELYTFKYDENISKEFLTKISTNFIITKVIITLNHIVENNDIKCKISITHFNIPIIENSINYFNNKIEYACVPYLYYINFDNILININNKLTIEESEWIKCDFIIKESKGILRLAIYYNTDKINNLIIETNVFNDYDEFKNYFLTYTKISEEQYKQYIIKYYNDQCIEDSEVVLSFTNKLYDNDNIIIFNDNLDNL